MTPRRKGEHARKLMRSSGKTEKAGKVWVLDDLHK
jgi:hypothetical protein